MSASPTQSHQCPEKPGPGLEHTLICLVGDVYIKLSAIVNRTHSFITLFNFRKIVFNRTVNTLTIRVEKVSRKPWEFRLELPATSAVKKLFKPESMPAVNRRDHQKSPFLTPGQRKSGPPESGSPLFSRKCQNNTFSSSSTLPCQQVPYPFFTI
jgi:hypothetical protein